MNKKFIIGLGVLAGISVVVIIVNLFISLREKNNFSPTSPKSYTPVVQKEVSPEDNPALLPQGDYEVKEEDSNSPHFLLN